MLHRHVSTEAQNGQTQNTGSTEGSDGMGVLLVVICHLQILHAGHLTQENRDFSVQLIILCAVYSS